MDDRPGHFEFAISADDTARDGHPPGSRGGEPDAAACGFIFRTSIRNVLLRLSISYRVTHVLHSRTCGALMTINWICSLEAAILPLNYARERGFLIFGSER